MLILVVPSRFFVSHYPLNNHTFLSVSLQIFSRDQLSEVDMSHTIWRTCIALVSLTRTRFACSQKLHRNLPNTEKNNLIKNHTEPILLSCTKFEKKPKQFGLCKSTKVPLENLSKHNRHIPDYSNFFLFDRWCSHKQYLQMWTTRTRFAGSQKLPNRKTNSTEVFPAMKRTSVWKIIPNWLCYPPQNSKNRFFELGLQELTLLTLKNFQTAKLTLQKSS